MLSPLSCGGFVNAAGQRAGALAGHLVEGARRRLHVLISTARDAPGGQRKPAHFASPRGASRADDEPFGARSVVRRVIPPRQRGRDVWRRTLLGEISGRIARAKAFANLMSFFGTHVFAIQRSVRALDRWRHLCFAKRHRRRHSSVRSPWKKGRRRCDPRDCPPTLSVKTPALTAFWQSKDHRAEASGQIFVEDAHSWGGGPGRMGSAVPSR
jgi:hypothetical protein